jgi:hypothetical protein
MQETCLRLMGKKMLVALMMEGKFSGEGLQSLDTDEDLMSAMARELVEKGRCRRIRSPAEQAGIHLVEPPAGVRIRKNPSPWPTATEPAVQLSLFG